jgi:hypothetical protein
MLQTKSLLKAAAIAILWCGSHGCATEALSYRGSQVEMTQALEREDCKNLGPVFGKGGGAFGGVWISDERLMEYAANDLRNKAAERGATHVVFTTHQMGQTSGEHGGTTSTATLTGVAYWCPADNQPAAQTSQVVAPVGPTPAAAR